MTDNGHYVNNFNNFGDCRDLRVCASDWLPVILRSGHNTLFIHTLATYPLYRSLGGVRDREGLG